MASFFLFVLVPSALLGIAAAAVGAVVYRRRKLELDTETRGSLPPSPAE